MKLLRSSLLMQFVTALAGVAVAATALAAELSEQQAIGAIAVLSLVAAVLHQRARPANESPPREAAATASGMSPKKSSKSAGA